MTTTGRTQLIVKIFSPLVYAAAVIPMALLIFWIGPWLYLATEPLFPPEVPTAPPSQSVATALYFGLPYLVLGGVLYGLTSWLLLLLERLRRPTLLDHLRHCAFLYPFVILFAPLVIALVPWDDPGGGGVIAIISVAAAACALLVDALVLLTKRSRSDRVNAGDPT